MLLTELNPPYFTENFENKPRRGVIFIASDFDKRFQPRRSVIFCDRVTSVNNEKLRDVINTVANKAVLILGRFTPERKAILDAIREELRKYDYLPILFDFEKPHDRDFTETVMTLAGLSKFIIADISEPKSSPVESHAIIPNFMVPFVPIIQAGEKPFSMFVDLQNKHDWVLPTVSYKNKNDLIGNFNEGVLKKAEEKYQEINAKKTKEMQAPIPIIGIK